MAELQNDFSWSHSRDRAFRDCARQYWFNYYGYWGGWDAAADPRARDAYLLKKLTTRPMWVGTAVHRALEGRLREVRSGRPPADDAVEARMLDGMRRFYRFSRDGGYRRRPKEGGFFEHEYAVPVTDDEWRESADHARRCLRAFLASPLRARLDGLAPADFLSIDDLMDFSLDGVKVNVALDLCVREAGGVTIYDWKTGATDGAATADQLAVYALFAHERWDIPADRVALVEVNLASGRTVSHASAGVDLDGARARIRASVAAMKACLVDPVANVAAEDAFPLTENISKCGRCRFKRICPGGAREAPGAA
jgi:hypothetical protein